MRCLFLVLFTFLSVSVFAADNDSVAFNPKEARKELAKCLKEAKIYSTEGIQATKANASRPKFASARKEIEKAKKSPIFKENEADIIYAAADVELFCYNAERNRPANKEKIDESVLYDSSFDAFSLYMQAYELYSSEENPKANKKEKSAIQKKAWPLFTATGGFRVNAAFAFEKKDWTKSHACWDLFIRSIDSDMVKDFVSGNSHANSELMLFAQDSIINHAKYFRALTSVLAEDHLQAIEELKEMRYSGYEQNFVFQELARQYKAIGEKTLYENTLIEGVQLLTKDPWFAQNLMNIYLESKDYDAASKVIDALLIADFNNPTYLSLKGTLVELQGNSDEALKYLERAYAIDSTNVDINSNLGRIWYNKGNLVETTYFDKRQFAIGEELSMPYYLKAVKYYLKAYEADAEHKDVTIANGVRNVLYKQFMRADCPNPYELINKYNEVSRAYRLPQFKR